MSVLTHEYRTGALYVSVSLAINVCYHLLRYGTAVGKPYVVSGIVTVRHTIGETALMFSSLGFTSGLWFAGVPWSATVLTRSATLPSKSQASVDSYDRDSLTLPKRDLP